MKAMKKIVAVVMIASLVLPTSAFAGNMKPIKTETPTVNTDPVEEGGVVYLSLEAASKLAVDNNVSLENIKSQVDIMENNREIAMSRLGGLRSTAGITGFYSTDTDLLMLTSVYSLDRSMEGVKYQEGLLEDVADTMVLAYYLGLAAVDEGIALTQNSLAYQQAEFEAATLKRQLGMISESDYIVERNKVKSIETSLEQLQTQKDAAYRDLKALLKVNYDFEIDYTPEYQPYEMIMNLDAYINNKVVTSNTLKLEQINLDVQQYGVDYYVFQEEGVLYKSEKELEIANRNYVETKTEYENKLRSQYETLTKLEQQRPVLEAALAEAQTLYETGKLSLELGLISQTDFMALGLAVQKAEMDLFENTCDYITAVNAFQRPDLLTSSSSGGNAG